MKKKIIKKIIDEVCEYYNFTPKEIFNATHKRETVQTRQLIQFLVFKYTKLSLEKVGLISLDYGRGKKHNHATILNSIKSVENRLEFDLDFYNDFMFIVRALNNSIVLPVYPVFNIKNRLADFEVDTNLDVDLLKENKKLKTQLDNIGRYKEINDLLALDEEQIQFFIVTRLKPFLRMLEVKPVVKIN